MVSRQRNVFAQAAQESASAALKPSTERRPTTRMPKLCFRRKRGSEHRTNAFLRQQVEQRRGVPCHVGLVYRRAAQASLQSTLIDRDFGFFWKSRPAARGRPL